MTRLGKYLEDVRTLMDWSEEIEVFEGKGLARLRALIEVDGQPCRVLVSTHENLNLIGVILHPPFNVKPEKRAEACTLLNAMNYAMPFGRAELDPADGELRYRDSLNVEFVEPTAAAIREMLDVGVGFLIHWMWGLAEVAITDRTAKEILAEEHRRCAARAGPTDPACESPQVGERPLTLH